MKKIILLLLLITSLSAHSKILDKIIGVINDQVYTLSEVERILNTLDARKEISPMIYTEKSYDKAQILKLLQQSFIIKDKLSSLGFVMSDDNVESRILETEKRLGLTRKDLLNFLDSKNISFNEYFELIREAMELNIFNRRIIGPMVSITEQEVKNYYYQNSKNKNNALAYKYYLVDFYLNQDRVIQGEEARLPKILAEYQKTGNIPSIYKNIETNDLGNVTGDDLPKDLSRVLSTTGEGEFSTPYIKNGVVHIFYVKKKDLAESSDFLSKKEFIYNQIFVNKSKAIFKSWLDKESTNYYIQENI